MTQKQLQSQSWDTRSNCTAPRQFNRLEKWFWSKPLWVAWLVSASLRKLVGLRVSLSLLQLYWLYSLGGRGLVNLVSHRHFLKQFWVICLPAEGASLPHGMFQTLRKLRHQLPLFLSVTSGQLLPLAWPLHPLCLSVLLITGNVASCLLTEAGSQNTLPPVELLQAFYPRARRLAGARVLLSSGRAPKASESLPAQPPSLELLACEDPH